MYIRYLRDDNRNPTGVVVAIDSKRIGYSLCCPPDRFDKKTGFLKAFERAKYSDDAWQLFNRKLTEKHTRLHYIVAEIARAYMWCKRREESDSQLETVPSDHILVEERQQ